MLITNIKTVKQALEVGAKRERIKTLLHQPGVEHARLP